MKSIYFLILLFILLFYFNTNAEDFWENLNFPSNDTIKTIAVNNDDYLFVGTLKEGIYITTNNGKEWKQINNGLDTLFIIRISINSKNDIFASLLKYGIYRSTNLGQSWKSINNNIKGSYLYINHISLVKNDDIFIGNFGDDLYKSTNNGDSWIDLTSNSELNKQQPSMVVLNSKNHIFVNNIKPDDSLYNGIYRSTNQGITWEHLKQKPNKNIFDYFYSLCINSKDDFFMLNWYDGIFRSSDNGESFEIVKKPFDSSFFYRLLINRKNHLYVSTLKNGIFRSIDNGNTWIRVDEGADSLTMYSLTLSNDEYLYGAILYGNKVFRSKYPLEKFYISAEILPEEADTLDWNDSLIFSISVKDKNYENVLKDANITIINSILNKTENIKTDTLGKAYYPIKIPDSTKDGTYPLKFFITKFAYEDSDTITRLIEVNHIIDDVKEIIDINSISFFPNPITDFITINYFLKKPEHIKIILLDILGIEKDILVDDFQSTGEHNVVFSISNYPAGVYFYRLEAGGYIITKKMQIVK